ncbi:MAG: hypothetical protein RLY86_2089, partial [Pseudomonadota bacterium]
MAGRGMAAAQALAVLIAGLSLSAPLAPAARAAPTTPEAAQDELKRLERDLKAGEVLARELAEKREALEAELADLRARLIATAAEVREKEGELDRLEAELARLAEAETTHVDRIEKDRAALAELLAALQRLSRLPPEAMIASPRPPSETLKSALMLRATVPELRERADALARELANLATIRQDVDTQRTRIAAAARRLTTRQAEIA